MAKPNRRKEFGPPKTRKEILAECAALKAIRPRIPEFSSWGIDQREMVLAQIQILEEKHGMDFAWKWWPSIDDPQDGDIRGACEDAIYWRDGGDVPAPSVGWSSEVDQPQKRVLIDKESLKNIEN